MEPNLIKKEQVEEILHTWQARITPAAAHMLEELFHSADRVLLEYAEKAESNAIRTKFIEGRKEIWNKKEQLTSVFHENLSQKLFRFTLPAEHTTAATAEVMSLVSKDLFERSLALQTISDQAVENHRELYHALSQRLGVVFGGSAVPFEDLPAGPHQLATIFESAVRVLNVGGQVLLALYTLFEREVIRKSSPWHEELNESLSASGILPNLKYEIKRDPDQKLREDPVAKADEPADRHRDPAGHRVKRESATPGGNRPLTTERVDADQAPLYTDASGQAAIAISPYAGFTPGADRIQGDSPAQGTEPPYHASGEPPDLDELVRRRELGNQLLGRIRELLSTRRLRQDDAGGSARRPDPVSPASPSAVAAIVDSPQVQQTVDMPQTGALDKGIRTIVVPRALLEKLRLALATQRAKIKDAVGADRLSHLDEDTIDIVGMLFEAMLKDNRLGNAVKALLSHLHTPYLKLAVRDRAFLKRPDHSARRLFDNMVEAGSRWVDERDLSEGVYPRLQRIVDQLMTNPHPPLALFQELDRGLTADISIRSERQQAREASTLETERGKARLDEGREKVGNEVRKLLGSVKTPDDYQKFMQGPWTDYLTLLFLRNNGDTAGRNWQSAMAVSQRLHDLMVQLGTGKSPRASQLDFVRFDLAQRLGDAIPQYAGRVNRLFALFSADHEVMLRSPAPPPATAPSDTLRSSKGGEARLERLRKLPRGSWVVFHEDHGHDRIVKLSWFNPRTERFLFVDQSGALALALSLRELADQIDRETAHVLQATGTSYVERTLQQAAQELEDPR